MSMPEESSPKTDDNDPLLSSVAEQGQGVDQEGESSEDDDLEDLQ
ncbi:hypothetical protein GCM10010156_60520 [Planobispora rosea]|uniref:Uncharacterized protein n=1 Tax=Planobispora rosea TaxID=35762 RepID=A0A8J3S988_PLARO|nr:hypothetical protein [Planobispora rosea]GGS94132.1 hypothetical protein GCM10010156_60520 [Planobispora rosea]GIH87354.1 hypothetical protein Pro02_57620 [Planobispora rosea]